MKKLTVRKDKECMACLACVQACSEAFYKVMDPGKSCIQIVEKNGVVKPSVCVQCGKCAKACEAGDNEGLGKGMTGKERCTVKKGAEDEIRQKAALSDVHKGTQGLLALPEHSAPLKENPVLVGEKLLLFSVDVQTCMNHRRRCHSPPRIEGQEHDPVCRVGSQQIRHAAKSAGIAVIAKKDLHTSSHLAVSCNRTHTDCATAVRKSRLYPQGATVSCG